MGNLKLHGRNAYRLHHRCGKCVVSARGWERSGPTYRLEKCMAIRTSSTTGVPGLPGRQDARAPAFCKSGLPVPLRTVAQRNPTHSLPAGRTPATLALIRSSPSLLHAHAPAAGGRKGFRRRARLGYGGLTGRHACVVYPSAHVGPLYSRLGLRAGCNGPASNYPSWRAAKPCGKRRSPGHQYQPAMLQQTITTWQVHIVTCFRDILERYADPQGCGSGA